MVFAGVLFLTNELQLWKCIMYLKIESRIDNPSKCKKWNTNDKLKSRTKLQYCEAWLVTTFAFHLLCISLSVYKLRSSFCVCLLLIIKNCLCIPPNRVPGLLKFPILELDGFLWSECILKIVNSNAYSKLNCIKLKML